MTVLFSSRGSRILEKGDINFKIELCLYSLIFSCGPYLLDIKGFGFPSYMPAEQLGGGGPVTAEAA